MLDCSFEYEESGSDFSDASDLDSELDFPQISSLTLEALEASPNTLCPTRYKPLSVERHIEENFIEPARRLQGVMPDFSVAELVLVLHHKKWSASEATSAYFDDWPKLRDACGLPPGRGATTREETVPFDCTICCEGGTLPVFALSCMHTFCRACYLRYVKTNIARATLIRCINVDCTLLLLYSDVAGLLGVEDSLTRNPLLMAAARTSATSLNLIKWCPAVDCPNLVEVDRVPDDAGAQDLAQVAIVKCTEAHEFCFTCQLENHLPCPCGLARAWIKRCEDDLETANWIAANTQGCPSCHAVIEKNGGCNHMVCGTCTYEFCWICLGDWAAHKLSYWKCNHYDPAVVAETKKKRLDKHLSLSRYLHYYKRFSVHQVSMDGDTNTLAVVRHCMLQYMQAQANTAEKVVLWSDVEFLLDAIRSLTAGRKTLMWTYAFGFYLKKSNSADLFEGMQDYLNKAVEDLSRLFEQVKVADTVEKTAARIQSKRAEIMATLAFVQRRRALLIDCAHSGLGDGSMVIEI